MLRQKSLNGLHIHGWGSLILSPCRSIWFTYDCADVMLMAYSLAAHSFACDAKLRRDVTQITFLMTTAPSPGPSLTRRELLSPQLVRCRGLRSPRCPSGSHHPRPV